MSIKERLRPILDRIEPVTRRVRPVGVFLKVAVKEWSEDKALRHAAALAYYSIFSVAPLLVIAIAVAGFFFGEQAVEGEIVAQLQDFIGTEGAVFIENMLREVRETGRGLWATIISVATMLFGALVIFAAVQDVLNMIWGVRPAPESGLWYTIRRRLLAFLMILLFGAAVLGTLLISSGLTIAQAFWVDWFGVDLEIWGLADQAVWLVFFTVIFGIIYKLLPDVQMAWRDVWIGAFMTGVLFSVGLYAISSYIAYSGVGTVFGAAGTLAVLLVWIYYSWIIVLMGAEMTQVWARRFGKGISPGPNAVLRVRTTESVRSEAVSDNGTEADDEDARSDSSDNGGNGEAQSPSPEPEEGGLSEGGLSEGGDESDSRG